MVDILFSVNSYDKDGDIFEEGVFLHFGDTRVKVAANKDDVQALPEKIKNIVDEINENY